jgi:hypothetical protein
MKSEKDINRKSKQGHQVLYAWGNLGSLKRKCGIVWMGNKGQVG